MTAFTFLNSVHYMLKEKDEPAYFTSLTLSFKTLSLGFLLIFLLKSASTSSSVLKFRSPVKE